MLFRSSLPVSIQSGFLSVGGTYLFMQGACVCVSVCVGVLDNEGLNWLILIARTINAGTKDEENRREEEGVGDWGWMGESCTGETRGNSTSCC